VQNCRECTANETIHTCISNDKELAGGRFIVNIATPDSSQALLRTRWDEVDKERSCPRAMMDGVPRKRRDMALFLL
jgi:hypothetical protein